MVRKKGRRRRKEDARTYVKRQLKGSQDSSLWIVCPVYNARGQQKCPEWHIVHITKIPRVQLLPGLSRALMSLFGRPCPKCDDMQTRVRGTSLYVVVETQSSSAADGKIFQDFRKSQTPAGGFSKIVACLPQVDVTLGEKKG